MKLLKYYFYLLCSTTLASCCPGTPECDPVTVTYLRIVDKTSGADLLFGPSRIYDHNRVIFYSLNGSDTVFHSKSAHTLTLPSTTPQVMDSILFVYFSQPALQTVYLKLSNTDTDTLALNYQLTGGSDCCKPYHQASVLSLNQNSDNIQQIANHITLIKK